MTYNILLQKAHAKIFNLMNDVKEANKIESDDEEMGVIMQ